MAKLLRGILSGISGKIGNVVGATWKGIEYIRSLPISKGGEPTAAQNDHRSRFLLATNFVGAMKHLFAMTFKSSAKQMTESNYALASIMKSAVSGSYPDPQINYDQVQVSGGRLPNAAGPTVVANRNEVTFNWTDNSGIGNSKPADKAILVAYSPSMNHCVFSTGSALRSSGTAPLSVPEFAGQTIHTWIAFMADDGKDTSPSFYTGAVTMP